MDIIEKMIKKGIYDKNEDLEKTKQERIDFINEIYKKEQEKSNFTYSCINNDANFTGQCNSQNYIEINLKRIDDMVMEYGEFVAAYILLITIFHELQHSKQYQDKELNLKNYIMSKEDYILISEEKRISQLPKKIQKLEPNYYIENHDFFEFEIDANLRALVRAYKLLNKYNCKEFNEVFERLVCEFLSYRNTREYYDIENKFDSIIDCNVKPFEIEYDISGNRKSFEELFNNNLKDKALYNKLLLNKIKETGYAPNLLKNILYNEINKIKEDIKIQEYFGKDNYFLKNELKKLEKIK